MFTWFALLSLKSKPNLYQVTLALKSLGQKNIIRLAWFVSFYVALCNIEISHLKLTQWPRDPVEDKRGLAIIADTVLSATGAFGSWEVSKKEYPPSSDPSDLSTLGPPIQWLSDPVLGSHLKADTLRFVQSQVSPHHPCQNCSQPLSVRVFHLDHRLR